jgi:hypothetical protein
MDLVGRKGRPFAIFTHAMGGCDYAIGGDQRARAFSRPAIASNVDLPNRVPGRIVVDDANTVVLAENSGAKVWALSIGVGDEDTAPDSR